MTTRGDSKFLRVNRQNPCPVCGKPDWCLIARDGKSAICARIESPRPAGTKGAGWLHDLEGRAPFPSPRPVQHVKTMPKAPPAMLDAAYRALLARLPLSGPHRRNLRQRGLTDDQVASLNYRTLLPNGRPRIAAALVSGAIRLKGVPGFYLKGGGWQLAGPVGIAIPVLDTKKRIAGLQVRCDRAEGERYRRYRWVSSRGFNAGCSPGAPVHVAGNVSTQGEVWITEGPIKADIAALKLGHTVLAVPGVGNWPGIVPIIRELRPARIVVAFDMDKTTNPAVKLHSDALIAYLIRSGIRTFEADWDIRFKGLDDLLVEDVPCLR